MNSPWTPELALNGHALRVSKTAGRRLRIPFQIARVGCLLAVAVASSQAQITTSALVQAGSLGNGAYNNFGRYEAAFSTGGFDDPFSDADAVAIVEPGVIGSGISGQAASVAGPESGFSSSTIADASATYQDDMNVLSPSLPIGAPMTLTFDFGIHGKSFLDVYDAAPPYEYTDAFTYSQVTIGVGGDVETIIVASTNIDGTPAPFYETKSGGPFTTTPIGGLITVSIANGSTFGFSMGIALEGGASAIATNSSTEGSVTESAYFDDDYADTLAWGGIVSATDQFGNPIAIPDLTSGSGIDYNQSFIPAADLTGSVPDNPDTLALMALSLVGLFVVSRTFLPLGKRGPIHRQLFLLP